MVSKTLQEIADFLGKYMFVQPDMTVFTSTARPFMFKDGNGEMIQWSYGEDFGVKALDCNDIYVSDVDSHDWKELVVPHNARTCRNKECPYSGTYDFRMCRSCTKWSEGK